MSGRDEMPYQLRIKRFDNRSMRRSVIALVVYQSRECRHAACPYCRRRVKHDICAKCGLVSSVLRVMRDYILYTANESIEVSMGTRFGILEIDHFYNIVISTSPMGINHILSVEERRI